MLASMTRAWPLLFILLFVITILLRVIDKSSSPGMNQFSFGTATSSGTSASGSMAQREVIPRQQQSALAATSRFNFVPVATGDRSGAVGRTRRGRPIKARVVRPGPFDVMAASNWMKLLRHLFLRVLRNRMTMDLAWTRKMNRIHLTISSIRRLLALWLGNHLHRLARRRYDAIVELHSLTPSFDLNVTSGFSIPIFAGASRKY